MRALAVVLAAIAIVVGLAGEASASPADRAAVEGILAKYRSPLPPETIIAFAEAHPDFDIAGYLAVVWCESSLGKTGGSFRYNNPGNIKPSRPENLWQQLASGRWYCRGQGWYNRYASMYLGQRAVIRLLYDRSYNTWLRTHQWERFARLYYGAAPGRSIYIRNLRAAHGLIVRLAKGYGASW